MIKRASAIKATAVAIVVVALLMFLVACGDTIRSGNKSVTDCTTDSSGNCVTVINYNGKPLNCVTWGGGHGEVGLDCDWVEYHDQTNTVSDNPEGFN